LLLTLFIRLKVTFLCPNVITNTIKVTLPAYQGGAVLQQSLNTRITTSLIFTLGQSFYESLPGQVLRINVTLQGSTTERIILVQMRSNYGILRVSDTIADTTCDSNAYTGRVLFCSSSSISKINRLLRTVHYQSLDSFVGLDQVSFSSTGAATVTLTVSVCPSDYIKCAGTQKCVRSSQFCNSCTGNVICPEGGCADSYSECSCAVGKKPCSSSGRCVADYSDCNCDPEFLCPDSGLCVATASDCCVSPSSRACPSKGLVVVCTTNSKDCKNYCPEGTGTVLCPDFITCAKPSDCSCPDGGYYCYDLGKCVKSIQYCNDCPPSDPYECPSSGECVSDSSKCETICSGERESPFSFLFLFFNSFE